MKIRTSFVSNSSSSSFVVLMPTDGNSHIDKSAYKILGIEEDDLDCYEETDYVQMNGFYILNDNIKWFEMFEKERQKGYILTALEVDYGGDEELENFVEKFNSFNTNKPIILNFLDY